MGRILAVVLGLLVLGAVGYKVLYGKRAVTAAATDGPSTPKRQLDNVRGAADRIGGDSQKAADDVAKKAFGE
ncbi:MAG: hypothetical protein IAE78_24390 [Myxococcus sp.]|nr:hypothetical protein [Myxococcus sp.]